MNIIGGQTITVTRSTKDRFGDPITETVVGTIEHCVFQWATASSVGLRFHPTGKFQETSDLTAVIFCPRDSAVQLEARDRFVMNGDTFQVVGDRAWDENMPATGYNFGYYMSQVEMVS